MGGFEESSKSLGGWVGTLALPRRLEVAAATLEAGALPTYRFYV